MDGKSSQTVWKILMLVCMVTVPAALPGQAAGRAPEVTLIATGGTYWLESEVLFMCWYGLIREVGCVSAVQDALTQAKIDLVEAACCEAINKLEDTCWQLMFPLEPVYPEFLKSCSSETLAPAPAPAPTPELQ